MKLQSFLRLAATGIAFSAAVATAGAQEYPAQPITLVVPFPAGGGTDLIGRQLAAALEPKLGVSVVVENVGGAAGTVGGARVAQSAPDGYTLLLAADQVAATGALKEAPYDGTKDLVGISAVSLNYMSLVAGPGLEAETVEEALAEMKANPGAFEYGSPGIMSSPHLAGEVFQKTAGVELVHVPYQGGGPALTDIMGGRIPLLVSTVGQAVNHVENGSVRMLMTFSEERLPMTPDVPTADELGLDDLVLVSFTGVFVPTGTPAPVIDKLSDVVSDVVESSEFQAKLAEIGVLSAADTSPEYLRQLVATTDGNMREVFGAAD